MRQSQACLLAAALLVVLAAPTLAHGPCGDQCLDPNSGPPGTEVVGNGVDSVLTVWNPRPNTLSLGVPGMSTTNDCDIHCAREKPIYHYDQPSLILGESVRPEPLRFTVPDAPPGRYLVVIYDGSENGFHYTWQPFTVVASEDPEGGPAGDAGSEDQPWLLIAAALAAGLAAGWMLRGRRDRQDLGGNA